MACIIPSSEMDDMVYISAFTNSFAGSRRLQLRSGFAIVCHMRHVFFPARIRTIDWRPKGALDTSSGSESGQSIFCPALLKIADATFFRGCFADTIKNNIPRRKEI
ncbi:hypothetical protein CFR72_06675 [Gluconacetobacter entanii]|uniref:Uncharacterized protein n=1 Tax=Gluconacetobacter entanii TaxID=108528 RepID=A0A318PWM9_9PROT|nr:hypothetical protein CFR72_06675 [Gluconacetobacter entanii]